MEERDCCGGLPPRLGGRARAELLMAPTTNQHPHCVFSIFFSLFWVVFTVLFLLSQIMHFFRGGHGCTKLVRVVTLTQSKKNLLSSVPAAGDRRLGKSGGTGHAQGGPSLPCPPHHRAPSSQHVWLLSEPVGIGLCFATGGSFTHRSHRSPWRAEGYPTRLH